MSGPPVCLGGDAQGGECILSSRLLQRLGRFSDDNAAAHRPRRLRNVPNRAPPLSLAISMLSGGGTISNLQAALSALLFAFKHCCEYLELLGQRLRVLVVLQHVHHLVAVPLAGTVLVQHVE